MGTATLEERIEGRRRNLRRAARVKERRYPLSIVGEIGSAPLGDDLPPDELLRLAKLVAAGRSDGADEAAIEAGRRAASTLGEQYLPLIRKVVKSTKISSRVVTHTDLLAFGLSGFLEGVCRWANHAAEAGFPMIPTVAPYIRSRTLRAATRKQQSHLGYLPTTVEQVAPYLTMPEVSADDITHIFQDVSFGETFQSLRDWAAVPTDQHPDTDGGGVIDGIRRRALTPGDRDQILARLEENAPGNGEVQPADREMAATQILTGFTETERELTLAWLMDDTVTATQLGAAKNGWQVRSVLRRLRHRFEAEFVASLDPAVLEDLMVRHRFTEKERLATWELIAGLRNGPSASYCRWDRLVEAAGFTAPTSLVALAA